MRSQLSFILTLTYGIADAANLALPGVAMVTAAGNLVPRQEYTCPTGGVYTWCPGHEGCCLEDEPCITTKGHVKCKAPCYGPSCAGDFCCDIGFECPTPGGKACLQATKPFPSRPSDLTLDFPTIPPLITPYYSDETTATSESEPTTSSTSYSSPTPKPEPSSVSSTTNSETSSQEASTSKSQLQSEVATTSAAKSNSEGPSGTSASSPVSTDFAVSLSVSSAPWAAWAITWGIGLIFMV